MTTPTEAEGAIRDGMPAFGPQIVQLGEAAGRVLAQPAAAERDQPPFDRVTMDGIAIRYSDLKLGLRFRIAGTLAAGSPPVTGTPQSQCLRIMTGAVLPADLDTVVPIERIEIDEAFAEISASAEISPGQFVHRRGSDRQAGERVLSPGTVLGPAEIAVLASVGAGTVSVAGLPDVAIISTGDELVGPEDPVLPHQIRSSNDHAIAAGLIRHRLATVNRHRLNDDEAARLATISRLHDAHDLLILSGGVSMGQFDYVPAVLQTLGCEVRFHKIRQKPGRPMWFGVSGQGKPIFALPGNPVSTLLCMTRYVIPAFRFAAGIPQRPPLEFQLEHAVEGPKDLTYFVPVVLMPTRDGGTVASPRPTNTSGDFTTLAGTDGFLELPPGSGNHAAGSAGRFFGW